MSIKTEEQTKKSEQTPMKEALINLFWVIFPIISIVVIVKLFEIYVNNNGLDSFLYFLILPFSLGFLFIIYPKVNKRFQQDQRRDIEKFLKNYFVIGYMVKDEKEEGFLDLKRILTKKTIKIDKKLEKEYKKAWLEEERKLFKV
jgi:hypothetical protein